MRSDHRGEYYKRHESQFIRPFTNYLQDFGVLIQYTVPRTPEQNGMVKRRNKTLIDSMMITCHHPESLG